MKNSFFFASVVLVASVLVGCGTKAGTAKTDSPTTVDLTPPADLLLFDLYNSKNSKVQSVKTTIITNVDARGKRTKDSRSRKGQQLFFDRDGKLESAYDESYYSYNNEIKVTRNENGYIDTLYLPVPQEKYICNRHVYQWNNEGFPVYEKLFTIEGYGGGDSIELIFNNPEKYDTWTMPYRLVAKLGRQGGDCETWDDITTYKILDFDWYSNWTRRLIIQLNRPEDDMLFTLEERSIKYWE